MKVPYLFLKSFKLDLARSWRRCPLASTIWKASKFWNFLICQPNLFLVCNQMKALILEKSSIFPLSLSGIGLMENTTKATSLAIQNCWNIYKGDSWRTKVPTPLQKITGTSPPNFPLDYYIYGKLPKSLTHTITVAILC